MSVQYFEILNDLILIMIENTFLLLYYVLYISSVICHVNMLYLSQFLSTCSLVCALHSAK